ncbi:hypothetical protein [Hymenobacter jeollabukensis]|uniref:Uncharacterized protein n=1 Tax=Hymenobacter jeollabukensis TaxID=2025313 RepID=A0A5R8WT24_9BACT|nr:hypothetical protein [Hymenobacter jeollabukensis]TLM94330.1 hypothetical protein FDY95_10035 [Hymenobacter jeollabukensis]
MKADPVTGLLSAFLTSMKGIKQVLLSGGIWLTAASAYAQAQPTAIRRAALTHLRQRILPAISQEGPAYWFYNDAGKRRRIKPERRLDSPCFCPDNIYGYQYRDMNGKPERSKVRLYKYVDTENAADDCATCNVLLNQRLIEILAPPGRPLNADHVLLGISGVRCQGDFCAIRITLAQPGVRPDHPDEVNPDYTLYFYLILSNTDYALVDWFYLVPQKLHPR